MHVGALRLITTNVLFSFSLTHSSCNCIIKKLHMKRDIQASSLYRPSAWLSNNYPFSLSLCWFSRQFYEDTRLTDQQSLHLQQNNVNLVVVHIYTRHTLYIDWSIYRGITTIRRQPILRCSERRIFLPGM